MKVSCNINEFENDISDLLKLFLPAETDFELDVNVETEGVIVKTLTKVIHGEVKKEYFNSCTVKKSSSPLQEKRFIKRAVKNAVYDALKYHLKTSLPWGSLTGVRPTKLGYELIKEGVGEHLIKQTLIKEFSVAPDKADLVSKIIKNQNCIIRNDKLVDLYINIPVCPTRCSYCSFISADLKTAKPQIPAYLEALLKEIRAVKKIINERAYVVRTIYVGGGTPSVLQPAELDLILSELTYPVSEITVECGRPDTITNQKLDVLKKNKVSRISINPQTFSQATLKRIGRNHTVKEVLESYKLAMRYGFDVNMDVIAGLPGEKFPTFKRTIDTLLELFPENITIHTLSIKRGSVLKEEAEREVADVSKMLAYGSKRLMEEGYLPYYLYRQKNQLGGMENVGYFRDRKICIFNVDSMEETCSVLACGANAISKRVYHSENRIERQANVKFLNDYVDRIDEMIERKIQLFK